MCHFFVFTILWCHLCSWNTFLIEPHLRLQILLYVIQFYIISSVMYAIWLVLTYDLLEDRCIDDVIIKTFFNSLLYKTNRFQVVVRLFSNRSQRTSKCGKNISDTLSCALCATFFPRGEKQDKRVRNIIFTKYNSLGQYQIEYLRQKLTDCQDIKWHLPFQIMLTKSLFSNPLKLPQRALPVLWLFPFVLWETSRENFPLGKLEVK